MLSYRRVCIFPVALLVKWRRRTPTNVVRALGVLYAAALGAISLRDSDYFMFDKGHFASVVNCKHGQNIVLPLWAS